MSPILYESYTLGKRKLGPARVKDTERTVTILVAAGKGTIVSAKAYKSGTTTVVTKLAPGIRYDLYVMIKNDGTEDTIWCTAKDKDTGALLRSYYGVNFDYDMVIGAGRTWGIPGNDQVMPNKDITILVEAGHGKR